MALRAATIFRRCKAYQFLRAAVSVISRRVDQRHAERNACAQCLFFKSRQMSALAEMRGALTDSRDNGAVRQLHGARWSVSSKN